MLWCPIKITSLLVLLSIFNFKLIFAKDDAQICSEPNPPVCSEANPHSIYIMSGCKSALLTIQTYEVRAEFTGGISKDTPAAEWLMFPCQAGDKLAVKLYNVHANRFICYSPCGVIIGATPRRAELLGNRCMFIEGPIPGNPFYISYESLYRPDWYLGFSSEPESNQVGLEPKLGNYTEVLEFSTCDFKFAPKVIEHKSAQTIEEFLRSNL